MGWSRLKPTSKINPMREPLRAIVRRIICPAPFGIGHLGKGSVIRRPRKVDGAKFISIGDGTRIGRHSWLSAISSYAGESFLPELVIGDNVYIGRYSCIVAIHRVVIEESCVLSEHVYISDSSHGLDPEKGPIMKQRLVNRGEVRIGKSSFIGYRACILPGVILGQNCVVGANSVVTKSFPAYSMLVGAPARLVKSYCPTRKQWVPCEVYCAEHEG
jgi:acetyltransferase-like isoleucine patch superfamily enzyme